MEALQKQIGWKRLVRLRWCFGVRALQPESRPQRLSVGLLREVCRRCLYSFRVFVCEAGGAEAQFVAAYDRAGGLIHVVRIDEEDAWLRLGGARVRAALRAGGAARPPRLGDTAGVRRPRGRGAVRLLSCVRYFRFIDSHHESRVHI